MRVACALNLITFEKAYCLYPQATLTRGFNLALKPEDPILRAALRKYHDRGWVTLRLLSDTSGRMFQYDRVRWIEDRHSLVVPLAKPEDICAWPSYVSPLSVTTWSISMIPCEHHYINLEVFRKEPAIYPVFGAARAVVTPLLRNVLVTCANSLLRLGRPYRAITS